jgi:hypothetical protein
MRNGAMTVAALVAIGACSGKGDHNSGGAGAGYGGGDAQAGGAGGSDSSGLGGAGLGATAGFGGVADAGGGISLGCPPVYGNCGVYFGGFSYDWTATGTTPTTGSSSFALDVKFDCFATEAGVVKLNVSYAKASDPYFGCVFGCRPSQGSVALLPATPPTTSASPSQAGEGITILFPNGSSLRTQNNAGDLGVNSGGSLSNAVTGSPSTWSAASTATTTPFPGNNVTVTSFTSWGLNQSCPVAGP